MKKLLVITYYWPPAGGIEVYRVVKFCKYLRGMGWDPMVLTVEGSTATASDPALSAEIQEVSPVIKASSIEPHTVYYALTGKGKEKSGKSAEAKSAPASNSSFNMGEFIRLNVFIPDARIGWLPAAVKAGKKMIDDFAPDAIFSTAPPYTVHLIASKLKKYSGLPWVADFRDPWVENYAYNTMYRFPWVRGLNEHMERKVLNTADRVLVATPGQQQLQGAKAKDGEARFHTITNGYDVDSVLPDKATSHFYISYFGSLSAQRVPVGLFEVLAELIREDEEFARDFKFRYAGRMTPEAQGLIEQYIPESHREMYDMLPHDEYEKLVVEHQLLLVLVDQVKNNDMIIPAKCFEMMITGNPMLAVGPVGGDTDCLLQKNEAGQLVDYFDRDAQRDAVLAQYQNWREGALNRGASLVPDYHRKALTQRLADEILNPLVPSTTA